MTSWYDLPAGPPASSAARQALKRELEARVSTDVLGRALLIVSEMIALAVDRPATGQAPLHLCVEADAERVRVTVVDTGGPGRDVNGRFSAPGLGGLPFTVLDRLSDRWGLVRSREGATAWSELDTG
jgi:anti-sigma regulatory factor (Ser/Thr protein kinase)